MIKEIVWNDKFYKAILWSEFVIVDLEAESKDNKVSESRVIK